MAISFYNDFESATLDHITKLLQADSYLITLINGNVTPQHDANIENPAYPKITIGRAGLGGDPSIDNIANMYLLVDVWSRKNVAELWQIYSFRDQITNQPVGVKALLHNKGFNFTEAIVDLCTEVWVSDTLYDAYAKLYRLSARYSLKIAAKTLIV